MYAQQSKARYLFLKAAIYASETDSSKNVLLHLISTQDIESIAELFQKAVQVRRNFVGDAVHLRGIIEFSNYCLRPR